MRTQAVFAKSNVRSKPTGTQKRGERSAVAARRFYWMTNAAGFIAFTLLAYMQQAMNIFVGYTVPFVSIALAFLVFLVGAPLYPHRHCTHCF